MSTSPLAAAGPPNAQPAVLQETSMDAHVRLAQMVMAIRPARAIYAAAQLGIPDYLAVGPRHVEELSRSTATHAPSLRRLLRALAKLRHLDGKLPLAILGLRPSAPHSRAMLQARQELLS